MKPVALITDIHTSLGDALVRLYLRRGYAVAATRSNHEAADPPRGPDVEGLFLVDWSRRSPISTRNVVLSTLNRFDRIDEALVLLNPALERGLLHELQYETVERAVDSWVKGSLFLLKSVLELYRKNGQGQESILALINAADQVEGTPYPPLEAALRGSFEATARSLFSAYDGQGMRVHGFEAFAASPQGFAEFIVETLSTRATRGSGRWHRFPTKGGLLGNLTIKRS